MKRPKRRGSVRKCQWMVRAKNWGACGKSATHVAPAAGMFYCETHAAFVIAAPLFRMALRRGENL